MKNAFRSGERIVLRPVEVDEAPLFQAWFNEPENLQYLQRFRPLSLAEERKWLETAHEKPEEHLFGIALREGERLIGCCGLHGTSLPNRRGELGIVIDPAAEHDASPALRQITPTLAARSSGVHSATAESNAAIDATGWGPGSPLNSGLSGCSLATSNALAAR